MTISLYYLQEDFMNITIGEISKKLLHLNTNLYFSLGENVNISTIKFLPRKRFEPESDILYFSKASALLNILPVNHSVNILCIDDCSLPIKILKNIQINLIIIDKNNDLLDIFNEVQDILLSYQRMALKSNMLLNALVEGKGLQYLVDIGFKLLGNPILLCDLSHKVMAYTRDILVEDPVWNEVTKTGYGSFSIISKTNETGIYEHVRKSTYPFTSYVSDSKFYVIHSSIIVENKPLGYLTVPCNLNPFVEDNLEIVSLISKAISLEMLKNKFFRNSRGLMYEYFIADLLDGKIQSHTDFDDRMKYLDLKLEENIFIAVIRSTHNVKDNSPSIDIRKSLNSIISYCKSILYNDDIVIIINRNREINNIEVDLKDLIALLKNNQYIGGISRCFHSLADIKEYYTQSLQALDLGTHMNDSRILYNYEDYVVYSFMNDYASSHNLLSICHPALSILADYDKRRCTDFIHSLYIYLNNDKNLIESANILHIHRNTLSYRINKITEIINLDINNKNISFHLLLSFKILKFDKIMNSEKHPIENDSNSLSLSLLENI